MVDGAATLIEQAWDRLSTVMDPEIPVLSVRDLGMIRAVREEGPELVVEVMPTFAGCPAIPMIAAAIRTALAVLAPVRVVIVHDQPWTSARITAAGRRGLQGAGFAPPPVGDLLPMAGLVAATCPYCGAADTRLESPFGPTACRAIHYCQTCRQPFEQFKAV